MMLRAALPPHTVPTSVPLALMLEPWPQGKTSKIQKQSYTGVDPRSWIEIQCKPKSDSIKDEGMLSAAPEWLLWFYWLWPSIDTGLSDLPLCMAAAAVPCYLVV